MLAKMMESVMVYITIWTCGKGQAIGFNALMMRRFGIVIGVEIS